MGTPISHSDSNRMIRQEVVRLPDGPQNSEDRAALRKRSILRKAQDIWSKRPEALQSMNVPAWYAGLHGVPGWYFRQPVSHRRYDEKMKGLTLHVRMNYILDQLHLRYRGVVTREHFMFNMPARGLRSLSRSGFQLGTGTYGKIICHKQMNTSFALSAIYNWKRALACTLRNFVLLLDL